MPDADRRAQTVHSVGHSNHPIERFVALLEAAGVETVADVRSHPGSRFHPQFNKAALMNALGAAGIGYCWLGEALGGKPKDASLLDASGHPDYVKMAATPAFAAGVLELATRASSASVAIMCAEEDPTRCHRALLVTPALLAHGLRVRHIRAATAASSITAHATRRGRPICSPDDERQRSLSQLSRRSVSSSKMPGAGSGSAADGASGVAPLAASSARAGSGSFAGSAEDGIAGFPAFNPGTAAGSGVLVLVSGGAAGLTTADVGGVATLGAANGGGVTLFGAAVVASTFVGGTASRRGTGRLAGALEPELRAAEAALGRPSRSRTTLIRRLIAPSGLLASIGSVSALPTTRAMRLSGTPAAMRARRLALARSVESSQLL